MRKRTKQLLGAFGLASVLAMTVAAVMVPVPDAAAVSEQSTSSSLTISVTVTDSGIRPATPSVSIVAPSASDLTNGDYIRSEMPIEVNTELVDHVQVVLYCAKATVSDAKVKAAAILASNKSNTIEAVLADKDIAYGDTVSLVANLDALGVESDMNCTITAYGGAGSISDSVEFRYRALKAEWGKDENGIITNAVGDPLVNTYLRNDVYSLLFQVYSNGKPVFVSRDGVEEPLLVTREQFDLDKMMYSMYLPMSDYNLSAGEYELVIRAYGKDGVELLSVNTLSFKYDPNTPNVPGTGLALTDLNISRADYILTGLLAFGVVAGFSVYLVLKRSRR